MGHDNSFLATIKGHNTSCGFLVGPASFKLLNDTKNI